MDNLSPEFNMQKELISLAREVRKVILPILNQNKREIIRRDDGGDPHFKIDEIAEHKIEEILKSWKLPIAYFSEDRGLVFLNEKPEWILIIDPIDGTRPAMANFESCCFSIVVAPYSDRPTFEQITNALVLELKSGDYFYADSTRDKISSSLSKLPKLNKKVNLNNMFWSTELTAHPIKQISRVCGDLIDNSVLKGAVFVFTSSSYFEDGKMNTADFLTIANAICPERDLMVFEGKRWTYAETNERVTRMGNALVALGVAKGDRVACSGAGFASHADIIWVPENLCVKLPENVSFDEGAFVMLGGIAMQGIRLAELTFGENVAVIGLGLLGMLTVQMLSAYGCKVIGIDIDGQKAALAKEFGASAGFVPGLDDIKVGVENLTKGFGVGAVIITASSKDNAPLQIAEDICRKKGKIILVGVADIQLTRKNFWDKELSFSVSKAAGPGSIEPIYEQRNYDYPLEYVRWTEKRNLEEFIALLSAKKVRLERLITHRFDIIDALKAYEMITDGKERCVGVLLEYAGKETAVDPAAGKVVLVNFWATWCGPCFYEHPVLKEVRSIYEKEGVKFLGVVYQDKKETVVQFVKELGEPFLVLFDPKSQMAIDYGVGGVPETFFIDSKGLIQNKFSGVLTKEYLKDQIEKIKQNQ